MTLVPSETAVPVDVVVPFEIECDQPCEVACPTVVRLALDWACPSVCAVPAECGFAGAAAVVAGGRFGQCPGEHGGQADAEAGRAHTGLLAGPDRGFLGVPGQE